jgi:ribosomal protein S18 acetylase RimI-like enzyme
LYRVQEADLETAANVLTRAMMRYPVFAYVIPDDPSGSSGGRAHDDVRADKLRHVLRFILGVAAIQGEILAPSRNIEAIAVWIRSENVRLSRSEALRAGFATLPFKVGLRATRRLLRLVKSKQAQRAKILTGRYHLLDMLGVDPKLQNQGHGRLLIEARLQEIDHERAQCYLETSDQRNISYYRRYGFELVHQHRIQAVPVYCLWRRSIRS